MGLSSIRLICSQRSTKLSSCRTTLVRMLPCFSPSINGSVFRRTWRNLFNKKDYFNADNNKIRPVSRFTFVLD